MQPCPAVALARELQTHLLAHRSSPKNLAIYIGFYRRERGRRELAVDYNDIEQHRNNKGAHEEIDKNSTECIVHVDKHPIGVLYRTEDQPDKLDSNKNVYRALGRKTAEIYPTLPPPEDPTKHNWIMLDADSEVPYEHIIGAVNACRAQGLSNLEFVGNPRFKKYYADR